MNSRFNTDIRTVEVYFGNLGFVIQGGCFGMKVWKKQHKNKHGNSKDPWRLKKKSTKSGVQTNVWWKQTNFDATRKETIIDKRLDSTNFGVTNPTFKQTIGFPNRLSQRSFFLSFFAWKENDDVGWRNFEENDFSMSISIFKCHLPEKHWFLETLGKFWGKSSSISISIRTVALISMPIYGPSQCCGAAVWIFHETCWLMQVVKPGPTVGWMVLSSLWLVGLDGCLMMFVSLLLSCFFNGLVWWVFWLDVGCFLYARPTVASRRPLPFVGAWLRHGQPRSKVTQRCPPDVEP